MLSNFTLRIFCTLISFSQVWRHSLWHGSPARPSHWEAVKWAVGPENDSHSGPKTSSLTPSNPSTQGVAGQIQVSSFGALEAVCHVINIQKQTRTTTDLVGYIISILSVIRTIFNSKLPGLDLKLPISSCYHFANCIFLFLQRNWHPFITDYLLKYLLIFSFLF